MFKNFIGTTVLLMLLSTLNIAKADNENLSEEVADMKQIVQTLYDELNTVKQTVKELVDAKIDGHKTANNNGFLPVTQLRGTTTGTVPDRYQFSSFGCVNDVISLSCNDDKTIYIYTADFGKYSYPCSDGCCPPNPGKDCVELVEDNQYEVWLAIKALCDNQTSCEYQYMGSVIDSCEPGYTADYMSIYFTCLPETTNQSVAFAAYHGLEKEYGGNEMVRFDSLGVNLGSHFQLSTNVFICPRDGIYGFSITFYSNPNLAIGCDIKKETELLLNVLADNGGDMNNAASGFVVSECQKGERIYVQTGGNYGSPLQGGNRVIFSGFLITPLF